MGIQSLDTRVATQAAISWRVVSPPLFVLSSLFLPLLALLSRARGGGVLCLFVAARWYFLFSSLFLGRYDVGNYRQIDSDIKIINRIRLYVSLLSGPKKK